MAGPARHGGVVLGLHGGDRREHRRVAARRRHPEREGDVRRPGLPPVGEPRAAAQPDLEGGAVDPGGVALGERRARAEVMEVRLEEALHDVEVAAERERGRGGQRIKVLCGVRCADGQLTTTCGLVTTCGPAPLGAGRAAGEAEPRERCCPADEAGERAA